MKVVEFPSELNADQTLSVPANVVDNIPRGQSLRVLVLIADGTEDQEWEQLAATEFGQGYADGDAIYEQLSAG
jgi:hypothetical protein